MQVKNSAASCECEVGERLIVPQHAGEMLQDSSLVGGAGGGVHAPVAGVGCDG